MTKNFFKILTFCGLWAGTAYAQQTLPLTDMSAFRPIKENWSIVGGVSSSIDQMNVTTTEAGTGILVCKHEIGKYGIDKDLLTIMEHGDLDIELDFMMAKGSNSGVYLQGRYEIQLFDSWGKKTAKYNDCGGIYERWDEARGKDNEGYGGYAPRQNASRAPGLWQHLKVNNWKAFIFLKHCLKPARQHVWHFNWRQRHAIMTQKSTKMAQCTCTL